MKFLAPELIDQNIVFFYKNKKSKTTDRYSIDASSISAITITKENNVVMAIDGSPKQVIYLDNYQEAMLFAGDIIEETCNKENFVESSSIGGGYYFVNKNQLSSTLYKASDTAHTVIVCVYGIDQHSRNTSFTQQVMFRSAEEAEQFIYQLEI